MQTLVQVFCKGNLTSLRSKIANDKRLPKYCLAVSRHSKRGRTGGWAKIHSTEADGVLNIEWDADTKILWTRVINKRHGKPDRIIGDFVSYLMARHGKKIKSINIVSID